MSAPSEGFVNLQRVVVAEPQTDEAIQIPPGLTLTVGDHLRTSYTFVGSSGGMLLGKTYFTPAIPPEATWLEVLVEHGIVRFEL